MEYFINEDKLGKPASPIKRIPRHQSISSTTSLEKLQPSPCLKTLLKGVAMVVVLTQMV